MKLRVLIVLAFSLLLVTVSSGQTDNTIHVKVFQGGDVGAKVTAAMKTCNPATVIPCILVIDASLASYPAGTMPALCAQCFVMDYRTGPPGGGVSGCTGTPGNLVCNTVAASTFNGAQMQLYNGGFLFGSGIALPTGIGQNNVIGGGAMASATTAYQNNLIGSWAGHSLTTGFQNVFNGYYSGYGQTTGIYNDCSGGISCAVNPKGIGNTGHGYESLGNAGSVTDAAGDRGAPNYNTGSGFETCYWCGYYDFSPFPPAINSASGAQSQQNDSDGTANTSDGYESLYQLVAGNNNTAVGHGAFLYMTNGTGNTCVGTVCGLNFGSAGAANAGTVVSAVGVTGAVGTSCAAGCVVTVTASSSSLTPGGGDHLALGGTTNWNNGHITTTNASSTQFTYAYTGYAFPNESGLGSYYDLLSNNPTNNTLIGYNAGRGIVTGSYNTVVGANVTGLAPGLANNVILADGQGNIMGRWDGTNWTFSGQIIASNFSGPMTQGVKITGTGVACAASNSCFDEIAGGTTLRAYSVGTNSSVVGAITMIGYSSTFGASHTALAMDTTGFTQVGNAAGRGFDLLGNLVATSVQAGLLNSAAGTALPTCASAIIGQRNVVSDATAPTYMAAYVSGGAITSEVICSYNGTTYAWLTH